MLSRLRLPSVDESCFVDETSVVIGEVSLAEDVSIWPYAVFFSAILLLFSLSAFWVMGSIFAMIIVTIPGTYPLQALKIAGDMVSQRRLAILKRILFLIFILALIWSIIIIPIIMLMNWLISINGFFVNIPIVPISMLLMSCFSCVLSSVYIYVLYRRIVDGDR